MDSVLDIIATSNYIALNKTMIKLLGLEEAVLLGELASELKYWEKKGQVEDGWFYSTVENIEENTSLSDFKQRKTIKSLKEKNIIDIKVKGIPAKRYIKINEEQVFKLLNIKFFNNLRTSDEEIKEQDVEKLNGNNNIINKNKKENKNNNNIYSREIEKNIIDYLNKKLDSNYKYDSKKTTELIKARLNQGFKEEDFYKVIDKKYNEWNDSEMAIYLRPTTLFGTKFEDYLNQKEVKKKFDIRKVDWDKF